VIKEMFWLPPWLEIKWTDQNLFNKVLDNADHVRHRLLQPVAHTSHNYNLRPRAHDRSLPERLTHLTDCNFIIRMLFYQVY